MSLGQVGLLRDEVMFDPGSGHAPTFSPIIVIGAGMAGTAAAVLGARGLSVTLIDQRPTCPPIFKAEKIEPDQAQLLRKLGLMDAFSVQATRIREIRSFYGKRLFKIRPVEQYGMCYSDMVRALGACLPSSVTFKLGRLAVC
jgi:2-polyprenyl-6-methoxyphenol hydroxylase-like FAD-dependent oxidoreductase